jgi:uncharacterized protein YycO
MTINPPTVIVALHRSAGWIGRLIRWQTRSDYSHASILFYGLGVIESREFHGVRRLPALEAGPGEVIDTFSVTLTPTQAAEIRDFALRQVGKPYDYTMVARFITRRQESRSTSGKWFCSELVFAAFQKAGVSLLRDTQPWEVSPGLLAKSPLLQPLDLHLTA